MIRIRSVWRQLRSYYKEISDIKKEMKVTNQCIDLIKHYEGCKLEAYRCPAGVLTIAYGKTKGVKEGQRITQKQADQYLKEDVAEVEHQLNVFLTINKILFRQAQFDAIVSFVFNLGLSRFRRSNLFDKIKIQADFQKDIKDIPITSRLFQFLNKKNKTTIEYFGCMPKSLHIIEFCFLNWISADGKALHGLYKRRLSEAKLYLEEKLQLF